MKTSHIIYKVYDLYQAVEECKEKEFEVEYGTEKNPYNAIIYFSKGPYLELLASTGMPKFMKRILHMFGKSRLADRLDYWDNHKGGPCGVALENYKTNLREELIPIIKELCDDPVLTLFRGNGIKDLIDTEEVKTEFELIYEKNRMLMFTDPVWTPLFSVACAVVSDTGGPLSHSAIVAREYGIPAVLGTGKATTVLKTGDKVMVDGNKGIVTLL